jgi:hemoglobin-like flavoprotein
MPLNQKVLRDTLACTLGRDRDFGERFYLRLFARHPELRSLFSDVPLKTQGTRFIEKLSAIVEHASDPAWVERELDRLSRSHRAYGVTAEMYVPVGQALIECLREACGDSWTPAAEDAWREAYAALTQRMLDSAN